MRLSFIHVEIYAILTACSLRYVVRILLTFYSRYQNYSICLSSVCLSSLSIPLSLSVSISLSPLSLLSVALSLSHPRLSRTEPSPSLVPGCAADRVAGVLPRAVLQPGRAGQPQRGGTHRQQITTVSHQAHRPPAPDTKQVSGEVDMPECL